MHEISIDDLLAADRRRQELAASLQAALPGLFDEGPAPGGGAPKAAVAHLLLMRATELLAEATEDPTARVELTYRGIQLAIGCAEFAGDLLVHRESIPTATGGVLAA